MGDTSFAPLIQILSWLFLSFSILSVVAQFVTKSALRKSLGLPDAVLLISLILGVSQTATILSPAGQLIGNIPANYQEDSQDTGLKALYGSELLSIPTLVTAKGSLLLALWDITPAVWHRIAISVTGGITVVWGVSSMFIIGLQCTPPERWNVIHGICINLHTTRLYVASLDIVTDAALLIIPSVIVLPVQMSWSKKATILGGFLTRIVVIAASIVYIIYIRQLKFDNDFLHNVWLSMIFKETVQTTSIMTACIPFLKPFLMSLESGFMRSDDVNRRTGSVTDDGGKNTGLKSSYIKLRNQRSWSNSPRSPVTT